MARKHEILWTNDEIGIVQADAELLVCHINCPERSTRGYWMMIEMTGAPGWWVCVGSRCGYEVFNDGTNLNRAKIEGSSPKDIAWWVATWAGVQPKDVEVSIGD